MTGLAVRSESARTCTVTWDPLAEVVVALAATGAADQLGPRYPGALRQEATRLVAAAFPGAAVAGFGARVAELGVNRVVAAAITRDLAVTADDPAARLVAQIRAEVELSAVPAPGGSDPERLLAMHRDSGFSAAPIVAEGQRVGLWPVRLLPPAPAGKLFARNTAAGRPLRMAFGDLGHVNSSAELDWTQWYRLGVWHAIMNKLWARQVGAVGSPELAAAYRSLPASHRRRAGVHEATVHTFADWPAYFLDALVSAGKVVLEQQVGGERSAAEQRRWLRALGRVHIDWFIDQLATTGIAAVDIGALARRWLAEHRELAGVRTRFEGPLAACESPMWSHGVDVLYSPSIDRATRRALGMWLRGHWPGDVRAGAEADLAAPPARPRLVYALVGDQEWVHTLRGHLQPAGVSGWEALAGVGAPAGRGPTAVLYTHRLGSDPMTWARVSLASTADGLTRLQQTRRAFADWTALGPDGQIDSGRVDYDSHGLIALRAR